MAREGNFSGSCPGMDYSLNSNNQNQQDQLMKPQIGDHDSNRMVDYTLNNPPQSSNFCAGSSSFDKLSFADVMQFADFGNKLSTNQSKSTDKEGTGIDPVYFLKFPVLNDKLQNDPHPHLSLTAPHDNQERYNQERYRGFSEEKDDNNGVETENISAQLMLLGENIEKNNTNEPKSKRKRPRTLKTSEEVESQRMTHIAVERNRRKQMNEHLRVLRSLMPSSYVQRGDQASIIGGAIEFVRELEQLLQCLESQKRRRLYGDGTQRAIGDTTLIGPQPQPPLVFPPVPIQNEQVVGEYDVGLHEDTAESKSCLADVEVKVLGFDALIKILSRRRPGQLIEAIAALEDLQLAILHTNITTIEQTVLYSFNVKIGGEARFTAEDIANSVQQIFSFIHANTTIS